MYAHHSHLKRILPRKDELYRPDFPSQYYSNSSIYSYSPTSSSDCPEHGRSHRKTKIVLTICVIFATLGVLSIAGVAAYLGFLSRSINNNGSQLEETYLFSTSVNRRHPPPSKDQEYLESPNGRSRSDFYPDNPIDLTNRLEDTNHQESQEDLDLNTKKIFYTPRNTTSILRNRNPSFTPSPVTVTSHKLSPPPPIDLQSPVILLNGKRNNSRYTATESKTPPVVLHFDEGDHRSNGGNGLITKETLNGHNRPSLAPIESQNLPVTTIASDNGEPLLTDTVDEMGDYELPFVNRIGAPSPMEIVPPPSDIGHFSRPPPPPPPPPVVEEIHPVPVDSEQGFLPVNPGYEIPTGLETGNDELSNHRIQLSFDRVQPEYYDREPWTPLLIRPGHLDKRPRIESVETESDPADVSHESYYGYEGTGDENKETKFQLTDEAKVKEPEVKKVVGEQMSKNLQVDDRQRFKLQTDGNYPTVPTEEEVELKKEHRTHDDGGIELKNEKLGIPAHVDEYEGEGEEEDDVDEGEENEKTRIYSLDPANTDMVPPPLKLGPQSQHFATQGKQPVENFGIDKTEILDKKPGKGDPDRIKSTTDFILSSLGSLNLVKTKSPGDFDTSHSENKSDPLFPPTRSYVSINLPLRPKPTESESDEKISSEENIFLVTDPEKKLRLVNAEGQPLVPDLTSTSTLNKVLSMMMGYEEDTIGVMDLLRNNTELVNLHNDTSGNNPPIKTREHKSFARDPKIDSQFRESDRQQIPVQLIHDTQPVREPANQKHLNKNNENKTWMPTKLTSLTVNRHNSPVYKFILRKGQSVEDLLKEIFHNYTEKSIGGNSTRENNSKNPIGLLREDGLTNVIQTEIKVTGPALTPLDKTTTNVPSTTSTTTTTSVPSTAHPPRPSSSLSPTKDYGFKTSTSVVVNEDPQTTQMPPNATFRCVSTGVVLSAFARCNSIKECADNSDEKNCKCVDYLKSQLLHRKICDGIVDCADESDESYCDWCSPGQYICSGSRACVSREKICDSRRDCPRGDDEANCVKIGPSGHVDELEDISPIYHQSGYLMVRKKGVWGKLCVESFSSVLSHWEIKDLARAVCKAKTFTDFETVEKIVDDEQLDGEPYYELYNTANETDGSTEQLYSSDESSPRSAIGFKVTKCKTRMVVKVRCQELQCGTAPRAFSTQAARIVGGSNSLPGEWPWQAALYRDGEYQCGATLISGRWLLSAGHCFYHAQDDYWVARLGTLRRGATVLSPYEQVVKITHIFLHPQYKDIGFVNDVSLLRLEKEVNFTDFVRPVCLPGKDTKIRDGRICTVVGWGQLYETGRVFPDTLQEVQLPLISTAECRKRTLFLPLYKLTDEMFCAGFDRGGRDACLGDSGGPLTCPENDGRWSLYGVTSNGYGCARANRPGVYTKTKSYLDWVYEKISQDSSFTYRDKSKPCSGHRCLLGECIEQRSVCNGISDCVDGSDEKNCTWS